MALLLPLLSFSQENRFTTTGKAPIFIELVGTTGGSQMIRVDNNTKLDAVEGYPYLVKEFLSGQIHLKDGRETSLIPLRYNIVNNQIEAMKDKQIVGITNVNKIDYITINGIHYEYINTEDGENYIFQVLINGGCKLLKKYQCTFSPANYNVSMDAGHKTPYYTKSHNLYIQITDNTPIKIKKSSKSILKAIGDKKDELKKYIKDNKLSMKNELDIKKVVNYYNILLTQE